MEHKALQSLKGVYTFCPSLLNLLRLALFDVVAPIHEVASDKRRYDCIISIYFYTDDKI